MENLIAIAGLLRDFSDENGELIDAFCYCYHHPDGVVPEYSRLCACRKPGTLFVEQAVKDFALERERCYFVGDQDSDVRCGKNAGIVTMKINNKNSLKKSGAEHPDFFAANLYDAALKIVRLL
jgi:histidinol phosphatase-like enzyme